MEGTVEAPCIIAERVEFGGAARVKGDVQAQVVAIAEGAVFDGSVEMQGEIEGPLYFKDQRQPQ